ncbi:MAG TPA: NAD(P)H-quinone oxidoreductase [Xanthobacteraceae bacterium]|jgi:putative PIG3 family NAD(P)H quinone oxidoreductase|nr:NAD(P)H-quinone oxidoreductase [Xanthobacteraceae bacterium]
MDKVLAVIPSAPGGPAVLKLVERPLPQAGPGQVLIRVAYAGINRHDAGQRTRGVPPAGATDVLGLEVSGEIIAVGDGVSRDRLGEHICALVNGGGYATHCLAESGLALPQPSGLDQKQSAAIPEALFTAWFNLVELGSLQAGSWVLVHGGAGGVGSFAIQISKALGCKVIVTASNGEKCDACRRLGADVAVNYKQDDFVEAAGDATGGAGVQVILDIAGGLYAERNLRALAPDGYVVHLSSGAGANYSAPLSLIMAKRARITGSLLRPLPLRTKLAIAAKLQSELWPRLGRDIIPLIDSVFDLQDVVKAHQRLEANLHTGKILLSAR